MTGAPTGLQVLESETTPVRWWPWLMGFAGVLVAAGGAYVLVGGMSLVATAPSVERFQAASGLDDLAVALLVMGVGSGTLALTAVRQSVQVGAVTTQQRTMLDAIVANVPDAVVVADGRGRFRANAAAVRLFGLATDSGSWMIFHEAMANLDRRDGPTGLRIPSGAGVLEAALKGRAGAGLEIIKTAEGQRTIHVTGSPIPMAHGIWGGLILSRDVTKELATQNALQAAKDGLEKKNAENLQMARAIAHDVGNALTPVNLHLALLRDGRGDAQASIASLGRSVAQIQRLVGDLADMARFQSGSMTVAIETVDLPDAIASAVGAIRPVAEKKPVELEAAAGIEGAVKADPERLGQVLTNLLSNALKFTPAGGSIRLSAAHEAGQVRVNVTDTGMGLDAAQIKRLFQPFSQVHDPTAVKERGTGLGLYICKGLIEKQGGQMGVTSPGHGKGSTFWFTLPVAA